jgi:methylase of polypeptide subunit release factors
VKLLKDRLKRTYLTLTYPESKEYRAALKAYVSSVATEENEATKATRFYMFLPEIYKGIKPEYANKVFRELKLERSVVDRVAPRGKTIIVRGRIDSLLGNVIFEFEKDLSKTLEEAQEQLRQYTAALWNSSKYRVQYTCIATDGISFRPYRPHTDVPENQKVKEDEISLDPREPIDLHQADPVNAYFWFDRYLLATPILEPSVERIASDFGSKSPILSEMIEELRAIWKNASDRPYVKVLFDQWDKYLTIVYGSSVGDEELFLRHTYLATLAKLIVYGYFSEGALPTSEEEIVRALNGDVFKDWKINNFLEEDFFAWLVRGKTRSQGVKFARRLIKLLARFDLDKIDQDMLREVYQELVDPETRKGLGEFYTPEWLTELLVAPLIEENPEGSVLDPACGSGTFLFTTIRLKRKHITRLKGQALLQNIVETVQGIDVHPLAVIVSKANYLLALGDLLRSARTRVPISVPVYLSNSIKYPKHEMDPVAAIPTYRFDAYGKLLEIPESIANNPAAMDAAVDLIKDYSIDVATSGKQYEPTLGFFAKLAQRRIPGLESAGKERVDEVIKTLFETSKLMANLIQEEKDTIWAFIIKNYYKPLFLRERKFDFLVGNPPWLTYKGIADPAYQAFIKDMIVNTYGLADTKGARVAELITHMEEATLFMLRCAEFYLKDGHRLAFVMPRSIFSADHHDTFRRHAYTPRVKLKFERLFDLEKVEPLFGMPACAVIAKRGETNTYPVPCTELSGRMSTKNVDWTTASKELRSSESTVALSFMGKRSALTSSEDAVNFKGTRSFYFTKFYQGATLVPRSLFFVEFKRSGKFGISSDCPGIKSSTRAMERAKKQYRGVELTGAVERDYLYAAITGSELVPFGHLPYLPAVLPVEQKEGRLRILTAAGAKSQTIEGLSKWFAEAENVWRRVRAKKKDYNLYEWLDYEGKLTGQNLKAKYRVVFPGPSSTYLVSTVLPHERLTIKAEDTRIPLRGLVIDHALLRYETEDENEAYYLSSMLNATTIDRIIKPFQSTGKGGAQNIHKKPLELPIPRYNQKNPLHRELSKRGRECAGIVDAELQKMAAEYESVGTIRRVVKERIAHQLSEIDDLAKKVLHEETGNNTLDRHLSATTPNESDPAPRK